jgi:hypothetical protein
MYQSLIFLLSKPLKNLRLHDLGRTQIQCKKDLGILLYTKASCIYPIEPSISNLFNEDFQQKRNGLGPNDELVCVTNLTWFLNNH